ncbi:Olfactory receptor 7G1 [Fukomys damarensis]|uniref:Olfactory receptor 7G1 n=1 Tax=Fukomys damarensis TaxID=885580 RepID=A0A091CLD7_FUKDA|nr:Olfactory receptor 7G1 [Fukomys damarensis]
MEAINQTAVSEFLLLGLTDDLELQSFIFSLFLSIYLVTVLGNLLIILVVISDSHLHTPMYFFLSHLSLNDICLSTTTVPKMLVNIQTQDQSITYTGCLAQICLVLLFGAFESCLLAAMAYDRYVAICHPLRYTVIMSTRVCALLTLSSFFFSIMDRLLHSLMILRLSFCTEIYGSILDAGHSRKETNVSEGKVGKEENHWHSSGDNTDVSEGQVGEQEIHEIVEVGVRADGQDDE